MDYAVMDKSSSRALFCALLLLAVVLLTSTRVQSQGPIESFGEAADCAPRIAACSKPTSRSSLLANTTRLPDECICANETICSCPPTPTQSPLVSVVNRSSTSNDRFLYTIHYPSTNQTTSVAVKLESLSENTSYYVLANNTNGSSKLSLDALACSEVLISYATVSVLGRSAFSPATNVCIAEEFAGPPQSVTATFEIDCDVSNRSAAITVTWQPPEDFQQLEQYMLQLQVTSTSSQHCQLGADLSITEINRNATEYTIHAVNSESHPKLMCNYIIRVSSFPGGQSTSIIHQTNIIIDMKCKPGSINYTTANYSFTVTWSLHPNFCGNVIQRYSVLFGIEEHGLAGALTNIAESTFSPLQNLTWTVVNVSPILIRYGFLIIPEGNPNNIGIGSCSVRAPPVPPYPITNITAKWKPLAEDKFDLTVHWNRPEPSVGMVVGYQIWVGRRSLQAMEQHENAVEDRIISIPTEKVMYNDSGFIYSRFGFILQFIYIQIRATNEVCQILTPPCYSSWSAAIMLPLPVPSPHKTTPLPIMPTTALDATTAMHTTSATPATTQPNTLIPIGGGVGGTLIGLAAVFTITALLIAYFRRRYLAKRHQEYYSDDVIIAPSPPPYNNIQRQKIIYDEWEIPWECLEVYEDQELGSGEFGEVFLGKLWMYYNAQARKVSTGRRPSNISNCNVEYMSVAVKMLRGPTNDEERASFLKEIDMMKQVSSTADELSRFVVNMLGCITQVEPLMLVVEFVRHGNLLNFLRNLRKRIEEGKNSSTRLPYPYLEPLGAYSQLDSAKKPEMMNLTERHILDFARQIAAGMEFLSGLDIVHRDLACRNILVGENLTLKISDFGLSRIVGQDEVYTLTNHGRLPLRWMALESIFLRQFTTAADVWSYGVTVWEICTLGKFPYAALTEKDLLKTLKNGYRLEQPDNCTDEIYDILQGCWHPDPASRPRFADLHVIFDQFLSHLTEELYPYIDLGFTNKNYKFDRLAPKESKIKPTTEDIKAEEILNLDTGEYCTGSLSSTGGSSGYGSTSVSYDGSRFSPEPAHDTTSDERNRQTQDSNTDREPGEKEERNETHNLVSSSQDMAAENKSALRERRKGVWRKGENGVVKGPYDELRLEDYLMLAEKAKKAQVKRSGATGSNKEGTPRQDNSVPHSVLPMSPSTTDSVRKDILALTMTLSTITEASCEDEGFSDGDHHHTVVAAGYEETSI